MHNDKIIAHHRAPVQRKAGRKPNGLDFSKNEKLLKTMAVEMAKSGSKVSSEGYHIAKLVGMSSSNLIGQGLTVAAGAFSDEAAKAVSKALLVASGRAVTGKDIHY